MSRGRRREREEQVRWLHERKLCISCGEQDNRTLSGRYRCAVCAERQRGYQSSRREALRKMGRCTECGARDAYNQAGRILCAKCAAAALRRARAYQSKREELRAKRAAQARENRAYLKSRKRCTACGKQDEATLSGRCRCAACQEKNRASAYAWRKRQQQGDGCAQCGKADERTRAGRYLCAMCAVKERELQREWYRKRRRAAAASVES